jgi:hypothetical protein
MGLNEVLAWVTLLVAVPLCVVATLLLLKKARQAPYLRVLRERYHVSGATTFLVLFFALIFVNNDQPIPPLSLDTTKIITRVAMLSFALVSAVGWILLYRSLDDKGRKNRKRGG